jgi:hypothetical protein
MRTKGAFCALGIALCASRAWAAQPLTATQMDSITAGRGGQDGSSTAQATGSASAYGQNSKASLTVVVETEPGGSLASVKSSAYASP